MFVLRIDLGSWRLRSHTVLPSARWRTSKAGSVIQSESEGLGTGALTSEVRRRCYPSSDNREYWPFLLHFALFSLSADWVILNHVAWVSSSLLSVQIQMLISSRTTLTAHLDNDLPAPWASLGPVKLHIIIILVPPNQEVAIVTTVPSSPQSPPVFHQESPRCLFFPCLIWDSC